jgi:hypothetical protein
MFAQHSNVVVKLLDPDESSGVAPSDFNVIEIIDLHDNTVQGKNKRKSYEVS